jgi:molybdopterin/thiamine biosynthesis adenylyltransferase/rhodanese-related sulfurtransferase
MPVSVVSVDQAYAMQQKGMQLIDVRETDEWATGIAKDAKTVSKAELEKNTCHYLVDFNQPVILLCAGGKRSDACAQVLLDSGYQEVYSVQGGTVAWQAANLPMQAYTTTDFDLRYARQMVLPNIGREGQEKLAKARILMVGAGGLGSPAAFYLAAAGVGHICIVDNDTVDLSNLQRQILHKNHNIGESKVSSAKITLNELNPSICIEIYQDTITTSNIRNYLTNIDLVIDGTDNFSARYAISDACAEAGIPWVYGAVYRFEGQVSLFHASKIKPQSGCYRCLFPDAQTGVNAPNCVEAGVLGVAPGVIGILQATEALKYLLDIGESLQGRLLHVDLLSMQFYETKMMADPECISCALNTIL